MDKISSDDGATSNATPLLRSVIVRNGSDNIENEEERRRPTEPWQGEFAKSIIYAGLDAIVTCFSLISSISAGRLSSGQFSTLHFIYSCCIFCCILQYPNYCSYNFCFIVIYFLHFLMSQISDNYLLIKFVCD